MLVAAVAYLLVRGMPEQVSNILPTEGEAETPAPEAGPASWTEWDEAAYPNYYRVVGPAFVDEERYEALGVGEISYSELDDMGRAGTVCSHVTIDQVREGIGREREEMFDLEPSGWGNNTQVAITCPDGTVYHGFFWNRSHLLAKSLGGEDIIENVICGTRMQNVGGNDDGGGMAWCEEQARDWIFSHPYGTVWYSATPVYEGFELVPRSVIVEMYSSDGTLDMEVEVFNTAHGYAIDYHTGLFLQLP